MLYPEYMSVYCDDDFTLWARMDGVEEDGMVLSFEHRHPVHGAHKNSATSRAVAEGGGESGGDGAASMHATTARNNGHQRYVRGARLFARRANGRKVLAEHLLRVCSVTRQNADARVPLLLPVLLRLCATA